jgi:cytochrome P450
MAFAFIPLLLVTIVLGLIIRPLFVHKSLRQLPSASPLAPFTALWLIYHNWYGRRYLVVEAAHRKHGDAIRISPNHVSFSSPQAYKDIYGHGKPILKDIFYDNLAGSTPSMADATNREVHSSKRRNVANIFAANNITRMEPKVHAAVRDLLNAIELKSQGMPVSKMDRYLITNVRTSEFDLRPWLNMFSFDAFSNMLWSAPFGFLKQGNDECQALCKDQHTVVSVHAMQTFQTGVHFNTLCAQLGPAAYQILRGIGQAVGMSSRQNADHFTGMVRYRSVQRLNFKKAPEAVDFFSFLPTKTSPKVDKPMSLSEIVAECTSFINAGNDTTQISLTNTMFELAANPAKQQKLHEILMETLPESSRPVATMQELQQIPFLRACLDESLRLHPPVRFGLPRRTTGKGTLIAGHHIPGNVTVSSSVHTLHHDETLFHQPLDYLPERWLVDNPDSTEEERRNLKDFVLPFTLGPRACIGRNLAYMELSICLAALIMKFEWRLSKEALKSYVHFERFNCSPKELLISAKVRSG